MLLACLLIGLTAAPQAGAETRALLVGVAGYPAFPARLRLRGAANDVQLMRNVLLERGVPEAHIDVLAEGLPGAGVPNRAAIVAALERMRVAARPGDHVMLLLAGHGGLQPPDADTPPNGVGNDGWVKTFLPLDAGPWEGGPVRVERALPGHELRRLVDAITARGANVFLLVDACHSAALVRGEGGLRWRSGAGPWEPRGAAGKSTQAARLPQAADELLGDFASTPPDPVFSARGEVAAPRGRTALYYAAQVDQSTPEVLGPGLQPGAAPRPYGLFTLTVAQVMRRSQQRGYGISYSQLAQQVMNEYAARPGDGVTPLLSGNGQDLPVLGGQAMALRQWPLESDAGLQVAAGALDGLAPGSVLALLADATARDSDVLGYAVVTDAGPRRARLRPQAHAGRPVPEARALAAARMARLASAQAPVALRLALDHNGCASGCLLQRAAQHLQREAPAGLALQWVADAAVAEFTLRQSGQRVQLLTAAVSGDDTAGALAEELPLGTSASALAQDLAARLHAMARVRNLLRIAARLPPPEPGQSPVLQLDVQTGGGPRRAWPAASVPRLRNGDVLHVTLRNPSTQGWDVTLWALDAAHGITPVFPTSDGDTPRLPPGGQAFIKGGLTVRVPPAGIERLLMIAVPQRALREPPRLGFLAQPPVARPRASIDPDLQALFDAVFAPDGAAAGTGRGLPAAPPADLVMQVYTADIRP